MAGFGIKPPKTLRKDLENYLSDRARLNRLMENEKLTLAEYKCAVVSLERKHASRIFPEDYMECGDERSFLYLLDFLKSKNPDNAAIFDKMYKHEKEHMEAIKDDPRLISAKYCMWFVDDDGDVFGFPFVEIETRPEDYLEVNRKSIRATTEKSKIDKLELGEE